MPVPIFEFNSASKKRRFNSEFESLIEQQGNDKVKSLVTKYATICSTNIVDNYGVTLLHLAAKYDNVELIDFLVKAGFDIDAKDTFGITPLVTALTLDKIKALETLINENADIWACEIKQVLRILITKKNILPVSILKKFMQTLKSCYTNLESMCCQLSNVQCPLIFIVYAGDSLVTELMLDIPDYNIKNDESLEVLKYVMKKADFENWRVFCQAYRLVQSRNTLFSQIQFSLFCEHWGYMRPLFKCLADWMVLDSSFLSFLNRTLTSVNKDDIQILLYEYNIDQQIMEKYSFNILPIIFANYKLDTEYLIFIARTRLMNINDKDVEGLSALHHAVMDNSVDKVQLIIELGADCNIKDCEGRTPLTYAYNVQCMELLLLNGADLLFTVNGSTVLETWLVNAEVTKFLLAQLAIDECLGVQIKPKILKYINQDPIYKECYEKCLQQVEEMIICEAVRYLTFFEIIMGQSNIIARFISSQETISTIMEWCTQKRLHPYYCSSLLYKSQKAYNVYRMKDRIAMIISKNTLSGPISFDHLVVDKICHFLAPNYNDILAFVSA